MKGTVGRGRGAGVRRHREGDRTSRSTSSTATRCGLKSDIEVFVPPASRVSVEGFQPRSRSRGVTGTVKAETVNGSISHNGAVEGRPAAERQRRRRDHEAVRPRPRRGRERPRHGARRLGRAEASTVNGKLDGPRRLVQPRPARVRVAGGVALRGHPRAQGDARRRDRERRRRAASSPPASPATSRSRPSAARSRTSWARRPRRRASGRPGRSCSSRAAQGGARVTVETLSGAVRSARSLASTGATAQTFT